MSTPKLSPSMLAAFAALKKPAAVAATAPAPAPAPECSSLCAPEEDTCMVDGTGQCAAQPEATVQPAPAPTQTFSFGSLIAKAKLPEPAKHSPAQAKPGQPDRPSLPTPPTGLLAATQAAMKLATQAEARQAVLPPPVVRAPFVAPNNEELEQRAPDLERACNELARALYEEVPGIGDFLQEIQTAIRGEPELMHILNDEQIDALYQGLIREAGVQIAPNEQKKAKAASRKAAKAAKEVSDDDM